MALLPQRLSKLSAREKMQSAFIPIAFKPMGERDSKQDVTTTA
jgi:hypothetical protein